MTDDFVRPRLVLVTTPLPDGARGEAGLRLALSAGDVASVILDPAGRGPEEFQLFAERLVPIVQDAGAAAIIADDTRCAGRVRADGLHLTDGSAEGLAEAVGRFAPRLIVGGSGFETRHDALEAGESLPDYILFGRLGGDTQGPAHERNLDLAEWWAEIVELPCILMGGRDIAALPEAAASGADFIALSAAVFADLGRAGEAVAQANAVFDALHPGGPG